MGKRRPKYQRLSDGRVGADGVFVKFDAPTGPLRKLQAAVFDFWNIGDDIVLPGNVVHIDFHDAEIWNRRA